MWRAIDSLLSKHTPGIVVILGVLGGVLAGCGPSQTPIPPGAQVVHVAVTERGVRLDPSIVHPGDVYLVLDQPVDGSIRFVERKPGAADAVGPLSDDDLAALAQGDTFATSISGLDAGGCAPQQNAESRGRMGPCGNVMKVAVMTGKYAILGARWTEMETEPSVDPTTDPSELVPPQEMAVLEVVP